MITNKKHGRVTLYYWDTEERGKTYLLKGKKTVSQKFEFIFRHIKKTAKIPRAHLHLAPFKDGYAVFDREGRRLFYGRRKGKGAGWDKTPVVQIETMHEITGYNA